MGKDLSGLRSIAARRSGMRCHYCRVPTAAEIEHMTPRSEGGASRMDNLVLSCPLCNKRKGTRSAPEFQESGDWRLRPPALSPDPRTMLQEEWGWQGSKFLQTGSRNARLRIEEEDYFLEIRPGKKYSWTAVRISGPGTSQALWDFLTRHFTSPCASGKPS